MGSAPIARRQGASPIFRASLVQTGLWPPPLRSGGETPPLAPCYPRLRQVAFGMYMPRFNADVQRPKPEAQCEPQHQPHPTPSHGGDSPT
jgi:hypothetical protein